MNNVIVIIISFLALGICSFSCTEKSKKNIKKQYLRLWLFYLWRKSAYAKWLCYTESQSLNCILAT